MFVCISDANTWKCTHMNCKQNEKISQVKVSNMVVGVDIGSKTHYARAFNWRGVELGRVFKFATHTMALKARLSGCGI